MPQPTYHICFLLGSPDISGGTYVIFEHASRLSAMGHKVVIVTAEPVEPARHTWHPGASGLEWLHLDAAREIRFDLVFATWWKSPYLLAELDSSHYAYFVQSIESRFFEDPDPAHHDNRDLDIWKQYCEATYSVNIPIITEASWIKKYLFDNYNHHAFLVRNGIRKDLYTPEGEVVFPREKGKLRVLVEGPVDVGYKNVPTSIELCRKAEVDEVWLLTSSDITKYPGVERVFSRVPINETPAIYRSCDVLVKLSYIEGMFGPPLEMFHCGGTSVVYDVTGHDEYIVHDHNSYVVPRDEEDQVVDYLVTMKRNPDELARLKQGAAETAKSWPDWQAASVLFNDAVADIMSRPQTSREYLMKWAGDRVDDNLTRNKLKDADSFNRREQENGRLVTDNFVQVYYWTEEEGLDPHNFRWEHYKSGEDTEVSIEMPMTGFPFWVRVDPSVQIGIIEVKSIKINSVGSDELLLIVDTVEGFAQLHAGGTMSRIPDPARAIFFSYGNDPQFILPAITSGKIGDKVTVTIALKETSLDSYFKESARPSGKGHKRLMPPVKSFLARVYSKVSRVVRIITIG